MLFHESKVRIGTLVIIQGSDIHRHTQLHTHTYAHTKRGKEREILYCYAPMKNTLIRYLVSFGDIRDFNRDVTASDSKRRSIIRGRFDSIEIKVDKYSRIILPFLAPSLLSFIVIDHRQIVEVAV